MIFLLVAVSSCACILSTLSPFVRIVVLAVCWNTAGGVHPQQSGGYGVETSDQQVLFLVPACYARNYYHIKTPMLYQILSSIDSFKLVLVGTDITF